MLLLLLTALLLLPCANNRIQLIDMGLKGAQLFLRGICRGDQSHQSFQLRVLRRARSEHLNDGIGIRFRRLLLRSRVLIMDWTLRGLRPRRTMGGMVARRSCGLRRRRAMGLLVALLGRWGMRCLLRVRSLVLSGCLGIRMVLLKVVRRSVVNHWPLSRSVLNRQRRVGILDCVQHCVEKVRADNDIAGPNLGHRLFRRILALKLIPLRLFWLRPVTLQDTIAEPLFL